MSSKGFKQLLFDQFARVAKALGNGYRLELLEFLAQGERSVESLAQVSRLSIANTSQHLQRLRQAGFVQTRMDGHKVLYSLSGSEIIELLNLLRRVAENNLAEVDRLVQTYLTAKDDLEGIAAEDLISRAEAGEITIIDVRPELEYRAGHVPGAINMPLQELEKRSQAFSPTMEIVAYCRGPYCVLAFEAVERLRKKGFKAARLEGGLPEWRLAGYPVETSN